MARTAVTQLQQQIEEVRREGFAMGYAAAMQAVREVASRSAPKAGSTAPRRQRRAPQAVPAAQPVGVVPAQPMTPQVPPLGCSPAAARN
jgi:hypothetical protein